MCGVSDADRDRWNEKYRGTWRGRVSPFLEELAPRLPTRGRALDLAGGRGLNALWLARRGLEVTLLDISQVALAQAAEAARAGGLHLDTVCADLDTAPLPVGPFELVVCIYFLDRRLFARVPSLLGPGGLFVYVQPTRLNLERNPNPASRYSLEPGELRTLVQGLDVLSLEEQWTPDDKHEARLLARAPER